MNHKPRILVVGSFVMDLIVTTRRFPKSGETVLGYAYQTVPGGKGANQAIQAARLNAEVTMVGKLGNDAFGRELLHSAKAANVDVSHVILMEDTFSAIGNVQVERDENHTQNRIIVVPGANMEITFRDVEFLKEDIAEYDLVMLQQEIPMEINLLVADYASAKGVPIMLNSAPYAPIPPEMLKKLTYISPNEYEAEAITGISLQTDQDVSMALKALRKMGVRNALITLGSRGVAYEGADGQMKLSPALKGLNVMDTTAAGDSFVGAFCVAVSSGLSVESALRFANHTAAITVCRMGSQPSLPTIDEVVSLMRERCCDLAPYAGLLAE